MRFTQRFSRHRLHECIDPVDEDVQQGWLPVTGSSANLQVVGDEVGSPWVAVPHPATQGERPVSGNDEESRPWLSGILFRQRP